MKTEQLVEQRIEKHLELGEEPPKNEVQVLNVPVTNNDDNENNDFKYARENLYHIIERGRDAMDELLEICLLYTSPSPRDATLSRMPSSA